MVSEPQVKTAPPIRIVLPKIWRSGAWLSTSWARIVDFADDPLAVSQVLRGDSRSLV